MVAIRDTRPGNQPPTYTRWSVLEAPGDLPDGRYTVHYNDHELPVRREGGLWLADESPLTGAA